MDHEQTSGAAPPEWPPPHPSPPLPPPPEYGSPGTPRRSHPWAWALAAAVVIGLLVALGLLWLVQSLTDDDGTRVGADPTLAASPTPPGSSASASPSPSTSASASESASASASASAGTSTSASASASAGPPAPISCWDGSGAQTVDTCSVPDGAAGMAWLFPAMASQRCGAPTHSGSGAVLRILCTDKLADGSRIQLGYYQWESVSAGVAFYDDQGLDKGLNGGFHTWFGVADGTLKSAAMYLDAPFSLTITLPAKAKPSGSELDALLPRPPDQVRGAPVG